MARNYSWLTGIILLWSAQSLCADTIYMKNGEVIEGEIISDDNGVIVIHEKFPGGVGYGESTYLMKNVTRVVTPEKVIIAEKKEIKVLDLEELKALINNGFSTENPVTGMQLKDGIYRIRYYYPTQGDKENDQVRLEENFLKVLAIFSEQDIEGFKSIQLEASSVSKGGKGILADFVITQKQFEEYKSAPEAFLIEGIERFNFFDRFYKK